MTGGGKSSILRQRRRESISVEGENTAKLNALTATTEPYVSSGQQHRDDHDFASFDRKESYFIEKTEMFKKYYIAFQENLNSQHA
jgi:hypothetical protein